MTPATFTDETGRKYHRIEISAATFPPRDAVWVQPDRTSETWVPLKDVQEHMPKHYPGGRYERNACTFSETDFPRRRELPIQEEP